MFWNKTVYIKNAMFVLVAILLVILIMQMQSIALLAFGSFVLACSLIPSVDKLNKRMPRGLASTIVILVTILAMVVFLVPIFIIAFQEIEELVYNLPVLIKQFQSYLSNKVIFGVKLIDYVNLNTITAYASQLASGIVDKSINITKAIMETITILITMSVIVFYMINEKHLVRDAIVLVFPPKLKARAKEVYENIEQKVGGYVVAQVLSMSTIAILTSIGLVLLNVPYSILLGLIAGLLDIVPIVGPTIALILGLLCAFQQGIWVIVLTIVVYLAAQWISNNFIRPLVFGRFLNLHPIIVIFAFLIAAQFLGVWGVILSPAIAALLLTLFDELYLKPINSKMKDKDEEEEK